MFTSQQYLELYAALTNPNSSKQANKALMEFEASPDVWRISEELLRSADAAHRLHGYLLISKKLNNPLPP